MFKRILPRQKPNIPELIRCKLCGGVPLIHEDCLMYSVECPSCINRQQPCTNVHRAVSRWNKKQIELV